MVKLLQITFLSFLLASPLAAQVNIPLSNNSFEAGIAQRGTRLGDIPGWITCGPSSETSPDIHSELSSFFNVKHSAAHGFNYMMMVTRDNDTQEAVGQQLPSPLQKDSAYVFSVYLAKPPTCISRSKKYEIDMEYNKGVILRIYAGNKPCERRQLLAESPVIEDTDWNEHQFLLLPEKKYKYLFLEAYYVAEALEPYNGSVLLDNCRLQSSSDFHQPMHKMIPSGKQYEWPSALKVEEMITEVVPEGLERFQGNKEQSIHFTKQYPSLVHLYNLIEMEYHFTLGGSLLAFMQQNTAVHVEANVTALRHIHAYESADIMEQMHHYYQLQQASSISKKEAVYHTKKLQEEFRKLLRNDRMVEKRIRHIIAHRANILHQVRMAMVDLLGGRDLFNFVKKQ